MVGFLYISISSCWEFLMMSRSKKLIRLLVSNVGESCMLLCMVGVAYCRLRVSAGVIINYYNVVYILGIERYAF